MTRLIDALSDAGQRWTAWSGAEASEAMRVCVTHFDNVREGLRAYVAYSFIASKRDTETLRASVSDSEVAGVVPKVRGVGFISGSSYSRTIKRDLLACGLLNYSREDRANAVVPTVYTFPMLERLLGITTNESAQRSNELGVSVTHSAFGASTHENEQRVVQNHIPAIQTRSAESCIDIQTSRARGSEVEKPCLERGTLYNSAPSLSWQPIYPPETCPYCGAGGTVWATRDGVDYAACKNCGQTKTLAEWRADGYAILKASPDIPF